MATLDHYIQGSFTSDGVAKIINLVSDVDFFWAQNLTKIITPVGGTGVEFFWQRGFPQQSAIQKTSLGVSTQITTDGFSLINTADPQTPGPQLSGTAISGATPPIVSSANTGTLQNGDLVQLYNAAGALEFSGMLFSVDTVVTNTSFRLPFAPTIVAGTTVNYRVIKFQAQYYPRRLQVTAISNALQAVVKFSVKHNLTVGQRIVFGNVPVMYGMFEISGLRGLIVAIDVTLNTVTVDIDTTAFTPFAFPLTVTAATAHNLPSVQPFGDGPFTLANPLGNQSVLDGATRNLAVRGMYMGAGANAPAGLTGDVIYWRAWKAEQVQTTFFTP